MRLIDADELAVTYCEIDNQYHSEPWILDDILAFLNDAPTIEAAPVVHGYWREYNRSALVSWKNGEPVWVDRAVYYCDGCSFGTIIKHNYCPRCGQKMDGCVSDG